MNWRFILSDMIANVITRMAISSSLGLVQWKCMREPRKMDGSFSSKNHVASFRFPNELSSKSPKNIVLYDTSYSYYCCLFCSTITPCYQGAVPLLMSSALALHVVVLGMDSRGNLKCELKVG